MSRLIILAKEKNPRLDYVIRWISEVWEIPLFVETEPQEGDAVILSYARDYPAAVSVPDAGLLFDNSIKELNVATGTWQDMPTIFHLKNGDIPFDLFSAVFFLLSRYEEYWTATPDVHDRYPATNSILYKNGWLQRPIIDEWLEQLRLLLEDKIAIQKPVYSFQASYDIDRAWQWQYQDSSVLKLLQLKNFITGESGKNKTIRSVIKGAQKDPADCYSFLTKLHASKQKKPLFFVLAAKKKTRFDRNISPWDSPMSQLIKDLDQAGILGIHPSYYSGIKQNLLAEEKNTIEHLCGHPVTISRQHFMRMKLPDTYRQLLEIGITDDYSMGYGSHLGFRAGTGRSFLFYDLQKEQETTLRIHSFAFMDSTALYHEKLDAKEAFSQLKKMEEKLKVSGSRLITIFHNFSLGTAPEWGGYRKAYESWISGQ